MRSHKKYIFIITLLFATQILYGCDNGNSKISVSNNDSSVADLMSSISIQHITSSVRAPDFELLSVKGERVSLSQYRGKVVLLSFWATW